MTIPWAAGRWPPSPARRMPLLVYAWTQVVLLGWWAVNFPGQLTNDSVIYVKHVTIGPWVANHSVLYDFSILCSLRLTGGIWLVTLAQTFAYAVILALLASRVRDLGVPARWAALPALLMVFVVSFGSFVSMLWKDVPFAASNLLLAATLLKVVARRRAGAAAVTWRTAVTLGAELLAITLFRNNGFVVVVLVAIVLVIVLKGARARLAAAGGSALIVFALCGALVYPAAGIRPANSSEAFGVFYADIAVVYHEKPQAFTPANLAVMKDVAPLAHWNKSHDCLTSDPLDLHKPFDKKAANAHRYQLARIWFGLLRRAPADLIGAHLCRGSIAWRVRPTEHFHMLPTRTDPNLYGKAHHFPASLRAKLRPDPVSWKLFHLAMSYRHFVSHVQPFQTIFARPAGWTWLAYLAVLVAALRRRRGVILLAALPILANQLTVIAANPTQLYRYTVVQLFLGMLLVPLFAAAPRPRVQVPLPGRTRAGRPAEPLSSIGRMSDEQ